MSQTGPADTAIATAQPARSGLLAACVECIKPGITRLVTITALVGLLLAGLNAGDLTPADWVRLTLGVIAGTALASGGANALNMWYESDRDARMGRTAGRPIPSERLSSTFVFWYGLTILVLGTVIVHFTCGVMPALVVLAAAGSYIILYTPLKPITIWNTLVGAIPGALPTMIGTAAVSDAVGFAKLADPIGLSLFALMMVWQIPHFLAIAWMCKSDYERGGFRMLPVVDPTGRITAIIMVATAVLLIPVSASIVWVIPDLLGWPTLASCIILGLLLVALCVRVAAFPTEKIARKAFIGSIIQLPVLLMVMVAEALIRTAIA